MQAPPVLGASSQDLVQLMATESELPAKRRDGPEYVVLKLLFHRKADDRTLCFKVKWADYEDLTWESIDCIVEELMCTYYRRLYRSRARLASTETPKF